MLGALACDHSAPFSPVAGEVGPYEPMPERLTFNVQLDVLHGFTSDGAEVFYTFCEDSKAEATPPCGEHRQPDLGVVTDRCVGSLPSVGGSRIVELCGTATQDRDSLKQYRGGTRLADGSVVFVYDARRPSASFSLNPALYILRPGELRPELLLPYSGAVADGGIPTRVLAAGGQRVVTLGGAGAELLTIHDDNTVTRAPIPNLAALDPSGEVGLRLSEDQLIQVALPSGTTSSFAPLPLEGDWEDAITYGVGFAAGRAVLSQERTYLIGATPRQEGRLVILTADGAVVEVLKQENLRIGQVAVAPDGESVVVERLGDLYKYTLP
jgi:hypothetical protein